MSVLYRRAAALTTGLLSLSIAGCAERELGNDAGQACADYRVAFEVAPELDAAGENVRRALDSPEVDRLAQQLFDLESSLNDKYPGWGEKLLANDSAAIARVYGSVGVQDIAEFGEAFKKLHEKILLECDFVALGVNSQSSPEVPIDNTNPPVTSIAPSTTTPAAAPALFIIDSPMAWGFCYEMDLPICSTDYFRESTVNLGYRLPPLSGIPVSDNRDESYWVSLPKSQRDRYLNVALWDWAARLGVSDRVQSLSEAEIDSEYRYMLEWSVWFANSLKAGGAPAMLLQTMKDRLIADGDPAWLVDYRINMVRWVALPAIAPEFLTEVDAVIVTR